MRKMGKMFTYKGFTIRLEDEFYIIYTNDEWKLGEGFRYSEHEAGSIKEAKEFIDFY